MIKSDVQITETAMNLPPIQLRKNLNGNIPKGETKIENSMIVKASDKLNDDNHFARLKRRMRGRSTSIF